MTCIGGEIVLRTTPKLIKVVSGGQTGADIAGLRAARAAGITTGGYAPKGWETEDGPKPKLLKSFGLEEYPVKGYPARTAGNVESSTGTLIIARNLDRGSKLTAVLCEMKDKPWMHINSQRLLSEVDNVVSWIKALMKDGNVVLNVAGNRESRDRGIERRTEEFLEQVFSRVPC